MIVDFSFQTVSYAEKTVSYADFSHKDSFYGILFLSKGIFEGRSFFMRKFFTRYAEVVAAFALMIATVAANSTCFFTLYQEEIPDAARKLRKF